MVPNGTSLDQLSKMQSGSSPSVMYFKGMENSDLVSQLRGEGTGDSNAYADRPIHAKHELKRLRDTDYDSYM